MKHIEINVDKRELGKHTSRTLRSNRKVPAIVYGRKVKSTPLFTDENTILKYRTSQYENAIFKFKSEENGLNGVMALMKEVDNDPVSRRPVHVDFYAVDEGQTVRVFVEVKFTGKPIGLSQGGVFTTVTRNIEIECRVTDIPEFINGDVSNLNVNESLHLSDLKLPEGTKAVATGDITLATVSVITEEEIKPTTPAAADGAAPAEGAAAAAAPGAAAPAAGAAKDAKAPAAKDDKKK